MRRKSRNGTTETRYCIYRSDKAKSASVDTVKSFITFDAAIGQKLLRPRVTWPGDPI